MEVCVNDFNKTVEIWLTRKESTNASLRASLKPLCAEYKCKKYVVAVFESGSGGLFEGTSGLVMRNRM